MKWTSSNKYIIKFLISLFIIGILIGLYIYIKEPTIIKTGILNELESITTLLSKKQNNIIYHIILLSILILLSIIILGIPLILFYFFYEGVSIGFLLGSLIHYKKISGLLFGIIFIIINKLLIYIALIYILVVSITYSKKIYISFKRKDYKIYEYSFTHLVKLFFIFIIIIISDIFIYFFANKILLHFSFLL